MTKQPQDSEKKKRPRKGEKRKVSQTWHGAKKKEASLKKRNPPTKGGNLKKPRKKNEKCT